MYEINVIRGLGGCFFLFVNVFYVENMLRVVSIGLWNYRKFLFLNFLVSGRYIYFYFLEFIL